MTLAEFKQSVRDRYPEALALHHETVTLLEPAIGQPRRHADLLDPALDMLFLQAYKAHVSVLLLVLHGHMEDAATIARRLLELAAMMGYFGLAPTAEDKTSRVKRYLADMWLDLPPEAQNLLPGAAKNFWHDIAEGAPRGALPKMQSVFSELGRQDTYDDDYRLLSRIAHGASSDQIIAFAADTVPVRPLWHLDTVLVVASRYFVATALVWNDTSHVIDQQALDALALKLNAWKHNPRPPSEAA